MAKGFKHGASGSTSLNFKIVGNPQPTNPKENTIWVNTDVDISCWYFSATEPENMQEGELWVELASASDKAFNLLKKNAVIVYPTKLHHYVGSELVDREGKIYLAGEWLDFETLDYVVRKGVLVNSYTIVSTTTTNKTVDGYLVFRSTQASSGNGKAEITANGAEIDFTGRSVLNLDVEAISPRSGTSDFVTFGVTGLSTIQKNIGVNNPLTRQVIPIDISGIASGKINLFISDNPTTVELRIYDAWFE